MTPQHFHGPPVESWAGRGPDITPIVSLSFGQVFEALGGAQKSGRGVPAYTRWVNRGLARFAAAAAIRVRIGANTMSVVSALFSCLGIAVLLLRTGTPATGLFVALLLAIGYVLDSADGQIARFTRTGSPAGEWLDHVLDSIRVPAIHLSIFVVLSRDPAIPRWFIWVPLVYAVLSAGHFMSQILAEQLHRQATFRKALATSLPTAPADSSPQLNDLYPVVDRRADIFRSLMALPTDTGILCWVFVLWGFPPLFPMAYGVLFAANAIGAAASMSRKYKSLQLLALPESTAIITQQKSQEA